jgi:hypothetical protein
MYYPAVGDIAIYRGGFNEHSYLVLAVRSAGLDTDYLAVADLLCLNTGVIHDGYPWPKHTWEKLA